MSQNKTLFSKQFEIYNEIYTNRSWSYYVFKYIQLLLSKDINEITFNVEIIFISGVHIDPPTAYEGGLLPARVQVLSDVITDIAIVSAIGVPNVTFCSNIQ